MGKSGVFSSHRRHKRRISRSLQYLIGFLEKQLYFLGLSVERKFLNGFRRLRRGVKFLFAAFVKGISKSFIYSWRLIKTVVFALYSPFKKTAKSILSFFEMLKETKGSKFSVRIARISEFFRVGWRKNKGILVRFINFALPISALILIGMFVYRIANTNLGLSVECNGNIVGYVENERVYDNAQQIIKGRLISSEGSPVWSTDIKLSLAAVKSDQMSSVTKIADSIITASVKDVSFATGLYISGNFYGATDEGEKLKNELDQKLEYYKERIDDEEVEVRFSRDVELKEGIYPSGSVVEFSKLKDLINSTKQDNVYYIATEDVSLAEISKEKGISVEELKMLNPELEGDEIKVGEKIIIEEAVPLLDVKIIRIEKKEEEIPIEVVEQPNAVFPSTYKSTIKEGAVGKKTLTYEVEYEWGVEVARRLVEETVTTDMKKEIVIVGTKPVFSGGATLGTGGALAWPTGPMQRISRGWLPHHHGIDIACQTGVPVYAADAGVVVRAEYSSVGYGIYAIVDHGNGMQTVYAHCNELMVTAGDAVARGQQIGTVGSTGNSTGPHLHFEVRLNGERVPPEPYIGVIYM